jgi:hypothetical protein
MTWLETPDLLLTGLTSLTVQPPAMLFMNVAAPRSQSRKQRKSHCGAFSRTAGWEKLMVIGVALAALAGDVPRKTADAISAFMYVLPYGHESQTDQYSDCESTPVICLPQARAFLRIKTSITEDISIAMH